MLLISCSKEISLAYKIKSNTSYRITKTTVIGLNETKTEVNSEFNMEVKDMENIVVSTIKTETKSNSEEVDRLTDVIKKNYSINDSTWTNPNNCKSLDSKSLISDNTKNHKTDVNTAEAIAAWNSQSDLPNSKLSLNKSFVVNTSHNEYSTIRKFNLDSIRQNIAFLSYNEELNFNNGAFNIRMNNAGITTRDGKVEYDIESEYYRLIYSRILGDYGEKDSLKNSSTLNSKNPNIKVNNETIIRITQYNNK
jgi:hypothetical protein